jgi:hypothetical protein
MLKVLFLNAFKAISHFLYMYILRSDKVRYDICVINQLVILV